MAPACHPETCPAIALVSGEAGKAVTVRARTGTTLCVRNPDRAQGCGSERLCMHPHTGLTGQAGVHISPVLGLSTCLKAAVVRHTVLVD
jgi:hypothetical protein